MTGIGTQIKNALGWFLTRLKGNVVNNLTSTSTDLPLSAAKGKDLQDQITSLNTNSIKVKIKEYAITLVYDPSIKIYTGTSYIATDIPDGNIIATIPIVHNSTGYGTAIPAIGINTGHEVVLNYHLDGTFPVTIVWLYN